VGGPRLSGVLPSKERYPIPYSEQFYGELTAYEAALHDAELGARIMERYTQSKVVVIIDRESKADESYEVDLLGNMALSALSARSAAGEQRDAEPGEQSAKAHARTFIESCRPVHGREPARLCFGADVQARGGTEKRSGQRVETVSG
jgi:hypothetical protein